MGQQCCNNIKDDSKNQIESDKQSSKRKTESTLHLINPEEMSLLKELNTRKSMLMHKESYLDFLENHMELAHKIINGNQEEELKQIIKKDTGGMNELKMIANQVIEKQKSKDSISQLDAIAHDFKSKETKEIQKDHKPLEKPKEEIIQKKEKVKIQQEEVDLKIQKKHEIKEETKQETPTQKKKKQKKAVDWDGGLKMDDIKKVMSRKDPSKKENKADFDNQSQKSFKSQKSSGSQVKGVLKKYNDTNSMYAGDNQSMGGKKKKIRVKWQENYKTGAKQKPKRVKK